MSIKNKRSMSVFSLVMLNVVAVDSLRSIPFGAKYGFALVFYYIVAGICFFIPTALVAAELATGWPETGGIYIWVREACGKQLGLVTIWLQWVYNIFWYPVILSLLAATMAYIINPQLVQSKLFMLITIMLLFTGTTIANTFGMSTSSKVADFASIVGSLFPMVLIAILGVIWIVAGKTNHVVFDFKHFWPHTQHLGTLVLLTNVLFSMVGIEMSAIHASDVKNPQKSYPKALFWSTIIILATLIGGSLAIAIVIPKDQISLMSGMLQVFYTFFDVFHIKWMGDVIAACIIIGGFGGVAAWVLGPSKGLMVAAEDGYLPKFLTKRNKYNAPIGVLLSQFVIFSLICIVYLFMPSVSSSFWVLSNITALLSLIAYLFMFAGVVILRYKRPNVKRAYKIPGGKVGAFIVAALGIISCAVTIVIGFLPPSGMNVGSLWLYETTLVVGVGVFFLIPFIMYNIYHKAYKQTKS